MTDLRPRWAFRSPGYRIWVGAALVLWVFLLACSLIESDFWRTLEAVAFLALYAVLFVIGPPR